MNTKYKKTYLSDGTQVKITEELFNQLLEWSKEGREFHFSYIDLLKTMDNEMINANRRYYDNNISLEGILEKEALNPEILTDESTVDNYIGRNIEMNNLIIMALNLCTESQKRRFFKYYYLDFKLERIAEEEGCSFQTVQRSIKKVEKRLINLKKFF